MPYLPSNFVIAREKPSIKFGRRSAAMEQAAPAPAQQTRPSSILYRSLKTMAHIVPLIQEIMPMVMTGTISVTKSAEVLPPPPASQALDESGERTVPGVRVISRNAVVDKSDKLSARGNKRSKPTVSKIRFPPLRTYLDG